MLIKIPSEIRANGGVKLFWELMVAPDAGCNCHHCVTGQMMFNRAKRWSLDNAGRSRDRLVCDGREKALKELLGDLTRVLV